MDIIEADKDNNKYNGIKTIGNYLKINPYFSLKRIENYNIFKNDLLIYTFFDPIFKCLESIKNS